MSVARGMHLQRPSNWWVSDQANDHDAPQIRKSLQDTTLSIQRKRNTWSLARTSEHPCQVSSPRVGKRSLSTSENKTLHAKLCGDCGVQTKQHPKFPGRQGRAAHSVPSDAHLLTSERCVICERPNLNCDSDSWCSARKYRPLSYFSFLHPPARSASHHHHHHPPPQPQSTHPRPQLILRPSQATKRRSPCATVALVNLSQQEGGGRCVCA